MSSIGTKREEETETQVGTVVGNHAIKGETAKFFVSFPKPAVQNPSLIRHQSSLIDGDAELRVLETVAFKPPS